MREYKDFSEALIHDAEIEGERLFPTPHPVFGGAWYHKVVSSVDGWLGIEGTVTLPEIRLSRYKDGLDGHPDIDPEVKSLDNPSVYLGGHAADESDVGLSLSLGVIDRAKGLISKGCIAFRPFWRYITEVDQDVGGYDAHDGKYSVSAVGDNCFANAHWKFTENYYLPGDVLKISVFSPEPDRLRLYIEVIEVSSLASSVETRKKYGWSDPADFESPVFSSPGHGRGLEAEFKRVNAIDQSGNEGGNAIPTETAITNAVWHSTYLYRMIDGRICRVPMGPSRSAVTNAPFDSAFEITSDESRSLVGGETVSIKPMK